MRYFYKLLILLSGFLLISANGYAAQEPINKKDPYQLIEQVSERTFERFRSDRELIDKDINHLKVIVEEELMPFVHHKYAASKVLGKNYKKLTKEQRATFIEVFRRYLIVTYANVFTLYDKQKITYNNAKKNVGKKISTVRVSIIDENRPPIKIDFKLRKSKKSGNWAAFDMIAEGVSMISSKQAEFNSVIRKHGIEHLIKQLDKKANESVEKKVVSS